MWTWTTPSSSSIVTTTPLHCITVWTPHSRASHPPQQPSACDTHVYACSTSSTTTFQWVPPAPAPEDEPRTTTPPRWPRPPRRRHSLRPLPPRLPWPVDVDVRYWQSSDDELRWRCVRECPSCATSTRSTDTHGPHSPCYSSSLTSLTGSTTLLRNERDGDRANYDLVVDTPNSCESSGLAVDTGSTTSLQRYTIVLRSSCHSGAHWSPSRKLLTLSHLG